MSKAPPDIPGYRIERLIGQGGMATVYLARQLSLDRLVAIKLMVPEASAEETQAQRFESEARVIARLEHPHIVGIHEVGRTGEGQLYYVMPFLPNGDLAHRNLGDDELRVVEILRALLDALGYAHARGIVHRDVKAENVLFDSANRPRLADFGIALSRRTGTPRITTDGLALGSSGYMAPEQARGEKLDGRADLYSVGVLTYELLTGELPFQAEDALALALMHDQDPVPRLPPDKRHWQAFIEKAMAKKPAQRYRNATAMLKALGQVERTIRRRRRGGWLRALRDRLLSVPLRPLALLAGGVLIALGIVFAARHAVLPESPDPVVETIPDQEPTLDPARAVAELIERAAAQQAEGRLVVPAGDNAAETLLAALRLDPLNEEAHGALRGLFAAQAAAAAAAIAAGELELASERIAQARLLAEGLGEVGDEAFLEVAATATREATAALDAALERDDRARAEAVIGLLREHGIEAGALATRLAEHRPPIRPGARLRDPHGPVLILLPEEIVVGDNRSRLAGTRVAMESPVTLADFTNFVRASGHQPARCRALLSPLRLVDQRTWEQPGFEQSPRDPVVCIAPADAEAYAAWLSRRTGQRYRLPSVDEQQHLALFARSRLGGGAFSSVAEWTSDCSPRPEGGVDCRRRTALDPGLDGRRWPLSRRELEAGRGYDDIGFRLVREVVDGRLPAPG
jgi:serine/threonine-protein kinase PpkA